MKRAARIGFYVVAGIVAGLVIVYEAMPKFDERPIHADRARMMSDLKSLVIVEEDFFRDSGYYSANVGRRFHPSSGVPFPQVVAHDSAWSATLKWDRAPGVNCGVGVNVPNPVNAVGDGEVWCTLIPYRH